MLHEYRIRAGFRQKDLAERIGFEQSYVSALELGLKGPPNTEFVSQLAKVLELDCEEQSTLMEALAASQRKVEVPNEAPEDIFWLCHKLRLQIDRLHSLQVQLITTALSLPLSVNLPTPLPQARLRRRYHKTSLQEVAM